MKTAKKRPIAANLRSWRVIIIRSKGEYLGSVEAAGSREGRSGGDQAVRPRPGPA
jgi:hypothetical protein